MLEDVEIGSIVVTRAASWMSDWGSFTDEIHHQDPEVAAAYGFPGIVLPPGALTGLVVDHGLLTTLPREGLGRRWTGARPVVVDEALEVVTSRTADGVTTVFYGPGGQLVATESFERPANGSTLLPDGLPTFRTGPIDATRIHAFAWGLADLSPDDLRWRWGQEPPEFSDALRWFVIPTLVAVRAAVGGEQAARRVRDVLWVPARSVPVGERISAWVSSSNGKIHVVMTAADAMVGHATVQLGDQTSLVPPAFLT